MPRFLTVLGGAAALLAGLIAESPPAAAATDPRFTFSTLADLTTPVPGGGGNFADFAGESTNADPGAPSLDHGAAVFLGHGPDSSPIGRYGVYRWENGVLSTVADGTMQLPGHTERMTGFGSPVINGPNVAFEAISTVGRSVVLSRAGALSTVASPGQAGPDGLGTFTGARFPVVSGNDVWFFGRYSTLAPAAATGEGIFHYKDGNFSTVARTGMDTPGRPGERIAYFSLLRGGRGEIAFHAGSASATGTSPVLYRTSAGGLVRVADPSTRFPNSSDNYFPDNGSYSNDGADTAFVTSQELSFDRTLWVDRGGLLTRVAVSGEPTPGGAGSFDLGIMHVTTSVDAGHLAFSAWTDTNEGRPAIFTDLPGPLSRLVGSGDLLFGKLVDDVRISPQALSGNGIAFAVTFQDGSSGVYLASFAGPALPEPLGAAGAFGGLAVLALARRRGSWAGSLR